MEKSAQSRPAAGAPEWFPTKGVLKVQALKPASESCICLRTDFVANWLNEVCSQADSCLLGVPVSKGLESQPISGKNKVPFPDLFPV